MFTTDSGFEDEVRRIARLLWPRAEFGGAEMQDGRERDGVFEAEEFVHVVECTVSTKKQKAIDDFEKLSKLVKQLEVRHPHKFCKGWFVTLNEPTADQRSVFTKAKGKIVALSFDQFRAKLVDARSYLMQRAKYAFGSVRDPNTGDAQPDLRYVPLDISNGEGHLHSIEHLAQRVSSGERLILVGDYGAGKSSTLREVHTRLAKAFWDQTTLLFPITINLRDHHGQTDPVEALERHARRLAFAPPEALVRAWRAGYVILLLDGFDEIATAGWAGKTKKLKDLRYRSMELLRGFVRESPTAAGLLVAGRAHFFDSGTEMFAALDIAKTPNTLLNLSEFNQEQVAQFLKNQGWSESIPSWVPSRPLLLGYLASRRLLQDTLTAGDATGPAAGWNALLDRICKRESEIEAGIDATTVRRLIEHVASMARASADGLGPIGPDQMTQAFATVCGYPPDDRGAVLLQRLPGLGGHSSEDGARVFIDADLAEAARGGAIFDFIQAPFDSPLTPENWQNTLWELGAEVAALRCEDANYGSGKLIAAIVEAQKFRSQTLTADVFLTLRAMRHTYDGASLFIREVIVPELSIEEDAPSIGPVEFQDAVIGRLEIGAGAPEQAIPRFVRCYFGVIDGRAGYDDLPRGAFEEPTVDAFDDSAQTTNAILSLSLPRGTKAVLTIIKKVYAQRGAGRKEGALYRGLDMATQQLVPDALALLQREGLLIAGGRPGQPVWLPTKSSEARRRALGILASPTGSTDPILSASRDFA